MHKQPTPLLFFGTRSFASAVLLPLLSSPLVSIERVITRPDRPAWRRHDLQEPLVKRHAREHNIPCDQPVSLKEYTLGTTRALLGIAAEYGCIIPRRIFEAFPFGILNIHPSILPRYRGPSPIQTAIMNGDTETGVTIMKIDGGLDTGPILVQKRHTIGNSKMYEEVAEHLADMGAKLLLEVLPAYLNGSLAPAPQKENGASLTTLLTRDHGRIKPKEFTAKEAYNHYRALTPWPGIWMLANGKRLKLLSLSLAKGAALPGQFLQKDGRLFLGCKSGAIEISELQEEGGKKLTASEFLRGRHLATTSIV